MHYDIVYVFRIWAKNFRRNWIKLEICLKQNNKIFDKSYYLKPKSHRKKFTVSCRRQQSMQKHS